MGYSKCLQHVREPKKKSDSIFLNHPAGNRRTLLLQISERTCPNSINLYLCPTKPLYWVQAEMSFILRDV